MKFADTIVDLSFKTREDGVVVFYPFSSWGKGYIVPDMETELNLRTAFRRFHNRFHTAILVFSTLLIVASLGGEILKPIIDISMIAVIFGAPIWKVHNNRHITRGLEPVEERLSWREGRNDTAKIFSPILLLLFILFFIPIALFSALMMLALGYSLIPPSAYLVQDIWLLGILTIVLFFSSSFGIVSAFRLILLQRRMKRDAAR